LPTRSKCLVPFKSLESFFSIENPSNENLQLKKKGCVGIFLSCRKEDVKTFFDISQLRVLTGFAAYFFGVNGNTNGT